MHKFVMFLVLAMTTIIVRAQAGDLNIYWTRNAYESLNKSWTRKNMAVASPDEQRRCAYYVRANDCEH